MRIVFCGTPEFAVPSLRRLLAEPGISVEAVITQPDRPRGRGQQVTSSPIKETAVQAGLHVFQPETIKSEPAQDFLSTLAPDAIVIIAYGQIIPARLLQIPRLGWVNLHASLLPRYRGAAPIQWAIANGATITGLTTMQIDAGMDSGPTLLRAEVEIGPHETAPELAERLSGIGAELMIKTLLQLDRSEITPQPQNHEAATYAPMLKKEDGRINWSLPAQHIYNRLRGFAPWPGAYTTFRGQTCHLWGVPVEHVATTGQFAPGEIIESPAKIIAACSERTFLRIDFVQLEGRKRIPAEEFARGAHLRSGDRFAADL